MLHLVSMHEGKQPIMNREPWKVHTWPVGTIFSHIGCLLSDSWTLFGINLKGALDAKDF